MTIQEKVPLAPLTTLQVGGEARYFAEITREDELQEAVKFGKGRELPLFVLGGGSNVVVADSGWPGLVIKIAIGGIIAKTDDAASNAVLFSVGMVHGHPPFSCHPAACDRGALAANARRRCRPCACSVVSRALSRRGARPPALVRRATRLAS